MEWMDALTHLGLDGQNPDQEKIDLAYNKRKKELNKKISSIQSRVLQSNYAKLLEQLEEAYLVARNHQAGKILPPEGEKNKLETIDKNSSAKTVPEKIPGKKQPESEKAPDPEIGKVLLKRYELRELIGEGRSGVVYRCNDLLTNQEVALRIIGPKITRNQKVRDSLIRQALKASKLSHPCISGVKQILQEGEYIYISMDMHKGKTLKNRMNSPVENGGSFSPSQAAKITQTVSKALEHVHDSTVHLNVNPNNIFLCNDGQVKLMDLGLDVLNRLHFARINGSKNPYKAYAAPELLAGKKEAGKKADQFSLAAVSKEIIEKINSQETDNQDSEIEDLLLQAKNVLAKAMQENPDDRFAEIGEFSQKMGFQGLISRKEQPTKTFQKEKQNSMPKLGSAAKQNLSDMSPLPDSPNSPSSPKRRKNKLIPWIIATFASLILIFALFIFFTQVNIELPASQKSKTKAQQNSDSVQDGDDVLPFTLEIAKANSYQEATNLKNYYLDRGLEVYIYSLKIDSLNIYTIRTESFLTELEAQKRGENLLNSGNITNFWVVGNKQDNIVDE